MDKVDWEVIQLNDRYLEAMKLSEYAFQYTISEENVREEIGYMKKHHKLYGILHEDRLAAKAVVIPFEVYIGEKKVKMGGIAGVATYPEYRRKGFVNELLLHTLKEMKNNGLCLSMLHPFYVDFYRRYGWELFTNQVKRTLLKKDLVRHASTEGTTKRYAKEFHPEEIEQIYEQYAKDYQGMLVRPRDWWLRGVYKKLYSAVYYNRDNRPTGYVLYDVKDFKMTVAEFVPLCAEARSGLWNFICQHDSMIDEMVIITPENEPLFFTLPEPRVKTEMIPYGMARIVDVEAFLNIFPFCWGNHSEPLSLHITDPHAPWNNRTFVFQDKTITTRSQNEMETLATRGLSLDINVLSTILFGYKLPSELFQINRISGDQNKIDQFERLIGYPHSFLLDHF